jgi:hypothetical protein
MPIGTFIDEKDDVELLDILPILLELQNASHKAFRFRFNMLIPCLHAHPCTSMFACTSAATSAKAAVG